MDGHNYEANDLGVVWCSHNEWTNRLRVCRRLSYQNLSNPVYVITKNLRKINVRNPMGMKLLLRVIPIITSIQGAILFQYGRYYKQQNLPFPLQGKQFHETSVIFLYF